MDFLIKNFWKSTQTRAVFDLNNTNYQLIIFIDGKTHWSSPKEGRFNISFEEVFENCPKDIQKKLAFHLDFFNS